MQPIQYVVGGQPATYLQAAAHFQSWALSLHPGDEHAPLPDAFAASAAFHDATYRATDSLDACRLVLRSGVRIVRPLPECTSHADGYAHGVEARQAGLLHTDCPIADGEARIGWFDGFWFSR